MPAHVHQLLGKGAASDFSTLWTHVHAEAESKAHDAEQKLALRGKDEAAALRKILVAQRGSIEKVIADREQLTFAFTDAEALQKRQIEDDFRHMQRRLGEIDTEIETEPVSLQQLYTVELRRISPVGLVYLWPETR